MSDTDETETDRPLTPDEMDALLAIWALIELCQSVRELFKEFDRLDGKQ